MDSGERDGGYKHKFYFDGMRVESEWRRESPFRPLLLHFPAFSPPSPRPDYLLFFSKIHM